MSTPLERNNMRPSTLQERFFIKFGNSFGKQDCLNCPDGEHKCIKPLVDFIESELSLKEKETVEKVKGEYFMAFGSYVPLGGNEAEPEVMAKEVARLLEGVIIERVREWVRIQRKAAKNEMHWNAEDFAEESILQALSEFLDTLTNEKR